MQPNLQPVPEKEEARRLVEIEMAATNGMLYTLDPHSVLLDVETYKDMRTQTQGKFGGLGIVIEMDKKNRITVKRPMPDTPAIRVGIKAKDHIVRINNESTVNMTLNEAVERLRGDVDTNVDVYVDRDGAPGREEVHHHARLHPPAGHRSAGAHAGGSGRARASRRRRSATSTCSTSRPTAPAIWPTRWRCSSGRRSRASSWTCAANPGGLYEQAQKVADAFIKCGHAGVDGRGRAARSARTRRRPTAATSRRSRWRCW